MESDGWEKTSETASSSEFSDDPRYPAPIAVELDGPHHARIKYDEGPDAIGDSIREEAEELLEKWKLRSGADSDEIPLDRGSEKRTVDDVRTGASSPRDMAADAAIRRAEKPTLEDGTGMPGSEVRATQPGVEGLEARQRAGDAAIARAQAANPVGSRAQPADDGIRVVDGGVEPPRANRTPSTPASMDANRGAFQPIDEVVDGRRANRRVLTPGEKVAILGVLVVFSALSASIIAWQLVNGLGGDEEPGRLRAGATRINQPAQSRGAAAEEHDWNGRAAHSYDDQQTTLADLQQLMADTDQKVATLLQTHGEQLDAARNVLDAADLTIMACTPSAETLLAVPGIGAALSLQFQLAVATPLVSGCNAAQLHAQHSSTHTAIQIDAAADAYRYIHTTATRLA